MISVPPGGAGHFLNQYLNQIDNNLYLDNSDLMINVIAQMDLEYQSRNTFAVRYIHSPSLGGEILTVTIGRKFLFFIIIVLTPGVLLKVIIVVPTHLAILASAHTILGVNPHLGGACRIT